MAQPFFLATISCINCFYSYQPILSCTNNMTKPRPAARLMAASAQCAEKGTIYGQCILASYQTMAKGLCDKEFQAFMACVASKTR